MFHSVNVFVCFAFSLRFAFIVQFESGQQAIQLARTNKMAKEAVGQIDEELSPSGARGFARHE